MITIFFEWKKKLESHKVLTWKIISRTRKKCVYGRYETAVAKLEWTKKNKQNLESQECKYLYRMYATPHSLALTCGKFALICRCKLSRSFSQSPNFDSISLRRSCASRKLSISLSRSSSIDTISCSKFASSPLNCDDRCEMESSLIVGRTSHIMFHILLNF